MGSYPEETDTFIRTLYEGVSGYAISQTARAGMDEQQSRQYTYGEYLTESLRRMLALALPRPGEVFFDLGSGVGVALLTAHLQYPFGRSIGVELLGALHDTAVAQLRRFSMLLPAVAAQRPVDLRHEDILQTDLHDADVVLGHWVCFDDALMPALERKLSELRSGARVLISSKSLFDERFRLLDTVEYSTSWDTVGTCRCYLRR